LQTIRKFENNFCHVFHLRTFALNTTDQRHNSHKVSKALEIIEKTLVAKGHSQTKPRRQVLEVFFHNDKPLTPAAVRKQLLDRTINLASVYRAIEFVLSRASAHGG